MKSVERLLRELIAESLRRELVVEAGERDGSGGGSRYVGLRREVPISGPSTATRVEQLPSGRGAVKVGAEDVERNVTVQLTRPTAGAVRSPIRGPTLTYAHKFAASLQSEDPMYVARSRLVTALQAVKDAHTDPVDVINNAIYEGANLASQTSGTVPRRAIVQIIFTSAVQRALGISIDKVNSTIYTPGRDRSNEISSVARLDAINFANALVKAYNDVGNMPASESKAGAKSAAQALIAGFGDYSTLRDMLYDIASSVNLKMEAVLAARIRTQADDLRPLLANLGQASEAVRVTATRVGAGFGRMQRSGGGVSPAPGYAITNPTTGERETKSISQIYRTASRETTAIAIPRAMFRDPNRKREDEWTPEEMAVFEQWGAATARSIRVKGLLLVAKAHYLLSRESDIVESEEARVSREDKKILRGLFSNLGEIVKKHPYGNLVDIEDVESYARSYLGFDDAFATSGDPFASQSSGLPIVSFTKDQASAIEQLAASHCEGDDLSRCESVASAGRTVSKEDLEYVQNLTFFPTEGVDDEVIFAVSDSIDTAFTASPDARAFLVRVESGASSSEKRVEELDEVLDEAKDTEVTAADNEALEDALALLTSKDTAAGEINRLSQLIGKESVVSHAPVVSTPEGASAPTHRPPAGEEALKKLAGMVKETMEKRRRYPSQMISQALGHLGEDKLEKLLDAHVAPLRSISSATERERSEAARSSYELVDAADADRNLTPQERANLTGIVKSVVAGGGAGTLIQAVRARTYGARAGELSTTRLLGNILLTQTNLSRGAVQLAIEGRKGKGQDIGYDTGTYYAFPFGSVTGEVRKRKGETPLAFTSRIAQSMPGEYIAEIGSLMSPGTSVVIPGAIKSSLLARDSDSEMSEKLRMLSLGQGRVVRAQAYPYTPTAADFTRAGVPKEFSKGVRAGVSVNVAGVSVNVAGVTVEFPAGQWRIGGISYLPSKIEELNRQLQGLKRQIASAAGSDEKDKVRKNIALVERELKMMPTIEDVLFSLRTGRSAGSDVPSGTASINERTGALTISRVAPAYLDFSRTHSKDLRQERWPVLGRTQDEMTDLTAEDVQTIDTATHSSIGGIARSYVLPESLRMRAEADGDLDSPFNFNRTEGDPIVYRVGAGQGAPEVKVRMAADGVKVMDGASANAHVVSDLQDALMGTGVYVSYLVDEKHPREMGAIKVKLSVSGRDPRISPDDAISAIQRVPSAARLYDIASVQPSEDMVILPKRDAIGGSEVQEVNLSSDGGKFTLSVGGLAYVDPMYRTGVASNSANMVSGADDLYGVGRITRLYYDRPLVADQPDAFRALLADLEFRGDQVRRRGVRGSILDPNVHMRGVAVAFLRSAPAVFAPLSPTVRYVNDIGRNYPPPTATGAPQPSVLATKVGMAGWSVPSPKEEERIARSGKVMRKGGLQIGARVRIVQDENPSAGAVGLLRGFVHQRDLSRDQVSSLRNRGIAPTQVNAIVEVEGGKLISDIHAILVDARDEVVGRQVSDRLIYPIFRHIDTAITERYLKAPQGAHGYHAYNVGSWDPLQKAGAVETMTQYGDDKIGFTTREKLTQSPRDTDSSAAAARLTAKSYRSPVHGSGAWHGFHVQGNAVHPADPVFAKQTGQRQIEHVVAPLPSVDLDTVLGTGAILRAILEHAPEASGTVEEMAGREKEQFLPVESGGIAGTYDAERKNPYPEGLHTEEARYFQHAKPMWYDVAMKSGRALAGAQARFGAKHVTRVGSPLGTSFRFQLDNAAGLEYTRLLREKLEATLDRAKAHHAEMISRIEEAKRNAAEESGSVVLCSDIASRFKRSVVDHLTTTLRRIETLGHSEERTDPATGETRVERVNSLEAYKKALAELDNIRVQNTVTHDVPEDVVAGIDGAIQEIASSLTGGNLLGSAPVPTAYTIEETVYSDKDIGHTGPLLKITLTDPQPVAEGMSSWIDLYRKIAADIGRREGDRVLAVREAEGHRTKSQGTALDLPGLKTRELEELVQFAKDMSLAPELSSAEQGGDLNLAVQTLATPEPGGSYVIINPQTDEREGGPFTTLAAARAEIESRRSQVLPTSRRGAPDEDPWRNVIAAFDISLADDLGNARRSSSRAASGDRYQAILDTTLRSMLGAAISGSHLHGKGDQSRHQTAMRLLRNLIKHDPAQLATFESLLSAAKAAFDRAGKVEISAGATRSYGGLGGEAAAAVSRLMERLVSDADPNADWDQAILLLPTLSDAIQSSLEEANAVGVFSSDTGGSERMTTLRGIQFARVSFEISPALKRAQAEFDRVTKAQISVIVKQLADVSGLFEGAKDQVGAEIARRMQANIKRLSDLLTLFSGGSTAGYQHLLSANHTATSRPRGALVAAGAVHVQPDQADGPARRAAFMEEHLQAAVEPLASIVASGKITVRSVELFERETAIGPVRMSASERSTRDQVTSINSRIEEIKSSHERHQLAQINLVADIPSLVDRMIQMTDVVSTDQVCVPITLPAEGELTESGRRDAITAALQARMGSTLPEDIVDAVLGAIEPL